VNTYLAGNVVRVATYSGSTDNPAGGFRDQDGTLADPTTVTLRYRPGPGAAVVTVAYPASPVIRDGTGLFHADLDTTGTSPSATWTYEWSGTGAIQAAADNAFIAAAPFL
jgi:hypothetical protein